MVPNSTTSKCVSVFCTWLLSFAQNAKSTIFVFLGLHSPKIQTVRLQWLVGLLSLLPLLSLIFSLSEKVALVFALCSLSLARTQANTLWWWLCRHSITEDLFARLAPDCELVHKFLWAVFFGLNHLILLKSQALSIWINAPIPFLALIVPAVLASLACLFESAFGNSLRPRPAGWIWFGVQASASWEEAIFRGFVCCLLWPLMGVSPDFLSISFYLFVGLGTIIFAVPHYYGGRPGGLRGVFITSLLGSISIMIGVWAGSVFPCLLLHGGLIGTFSFLRCHSLRRQAFDGLKREAALFLVRLRHSYYVTDWEGCRIRRIVDSKDPLANRMRKRIAGVKNEIVALNGSEFIDDIITHERIAPGLLWLRHWNCYLVVYIPVQCFPHKQHPAIGLNVLRDLSLTEQIL